VGTAGDDFGIVSGQGAHTINLPTASATKRGALSAADWSTFNGKDSAHANRALLDTYAQTEVDLADAVSKKHAAATAGGGISINGQQITNSDTGTAARSAHEGAYDHTKIHDAATAGTGIVIVGQEVRNNDRGSVAVGTHEATYDHGKLHDAASAGAGITVQGQVIGNSDKGTDARTAHEGAYNHANIHVPAMVATHQVDEAAIGDGKILKYNAVAGKIQYAEDLGGSGMAPGDASYITRVAESGLTNETPMSALATGLVKNTTGTGEPSIATAADVPVNSGFGAQFTILNPYVPKAYAYKGQLHAHCYGGSEGCVAGDDGDRGATTLAADYQTAGASFLAITSHSSAASYPVSCPNGFLCISRAAEVGCSAPPGGVDGHMTEWGVTTAYAGALQTCINNTYTAGGLANMAHPDYGPASWADAAFESTTFVEFTEIWNDQTDQEAYGKVDTYLGKGRRIWLLGVDDHHTHALMRGYVALNADALTWADIKAALRAGNFYAVKCTSGVCPTLVSATVTGASITVTASASGTWTWIGSHGASVPLKQETATSSSYTVTGDPWLGDHLYVRVEYADTTARKIWMQPFYVTRAAPAGQSTVAEKVKIAKAGTVQGTRSTVNLIEGTNITLTVADSVGDDRVNVTIASSAGGGNVTHTGDLTAGVPLVGNGSADLTAGSRTGNTTNIATATTGAKTNGNYPKWDSSGNLTDGDAGGQGAIVTGAAVTVDGAGTVIAAGHKGFTQVLAACTINSWTILADQAGTLQFDVWRHSAATAFDGNGVLVAPPLDEDSITGSAPPGVANQQGKTSSTLTGWSTSLAAGDVLAFNVDASPAPASVTRATLIIKCTR
jgi:hypothetical protein